MINFTANYPITMAAYEAEIAEFPKSMNVGDIKKFIKIVPELDAMLKDGEVISVRAKELRSYINEFVKAAFNLVIWQRYTYAGKWEALPVDLYQGLDHIHEARHIGSFEKKLTKVSSKDHPMYKDAVALVAELRELNDLVLYMKTIEVKASVKKSRIRTEKQEARERSKDTDVVYQAVLPMKLLAQDKAEEHFRESVSQAAEQIRIHNGDIDKLVPIPANLKWDSYAGEAIKLARSFYALICELHDGRLYISDAAVGLEVYKVRRGAGFEFDAYVYKLNEKINDATLAAELHGDPWTGSTLKVTTKNKGEQIWTTKIIVNVSKYGKLFNQFPTRQVS